MRRKSNKPRPIHIPGIDYKVVQRDEALKVLELAKKQEVKASIYVSKGANYNEVPLTKKHLKS